MCGLYHELLLLCGQHREACAESIYNSTNSKADFNFCSASQQASSREGTQGSYACRLLNGQLKPRLPFPSAVHSSALSQNWLLCALSGRAPQATVCEQLHCFCLGILITFFKSTYLYCYRSNQSTKTFRKYQSTGILSNITNTAF